MLPEIFFGLVIFFVLMVANGIHQVDEGYVAIYWMGGAILETVNGPGWHLKIPFLQTFAQVQITVQTDKVSDVKCGTSGGVVIEFEKIEVVNRLKKEAALETVRNYTVDYDKTWIFDKIHHEINQFCSKHTLQEVYIDLFDQLDERLADALQSGCDKWAPGIEIIAIRVTKPVIPNKLMKNYEEIESSTQETIVKQQKAETERMQAKIRAESSAEISKIEMDKQVAAKESQKRIQDIDNQIYIDRERSIADAYHYKLMKSIEAEQAQLTPEYLKKLSIESFTSNLKLYFGESIPKFLSENIDEVNRRIVDEQNSNEDTQT